MLDEGLAVGSITEAGAQSELLEDYPTLREGHTKLLLGYTGEDRRFTSRSTSLHSSPIGPSRWLSSQSTSRKAWLAR